ncbi:NADP oxidoreductase [candidate division GN15 bacterium]|nr:NADP oxidoreductase [candidate division GN15 bacterium]
MSFLDIDERLLQLAEIAEIVYSPIVDTKEFPSDVDIVLVEGSVSSEEDLHKAQMVRERSKLVVALGDCAVTGNIPSMRNPFGPNEALERAYVENTDETPRTPDQDVPPLLKKVVPLHDVVKVDLHIPGCPPPADAIWHAVNAIIAGKMPDPSELTRFGK